MAEPQNDWQAQDRHELHDPSNPPNVLLKAESRNRALLSYVLPIVILFVIVAIGLIYWSGRTVTDDLRDDGAVGTTGEGTPGGIDPRPGFGSTQEELEFRGAPAPEGQPQSQP